LRLGEEWRRLPFTVLVAMLDRRQRSEALEDWRVAWLAATILNALGAKPEVTPARLMPWLLRQQRKMSQKEMQQILKDH
jgi:hypothetical protein